MVIEFLSIILVSLGLNPARTLCLHVRPIWAPKCITLRFYILCDILSLCVLDRKIKMKNTLKAGKISAFARKNRLHFLLLTSPSYARTF